MPAHAVGEDGDAARVLPDVKILRFPKSNEVLVMIPDCPGAGKLVTFDFH